MKLLVVLLAAVSLCAGSAIPDVPKDNSHYVEGESRYFWMADGDDDEPQLVDLEETGDESISPLRDGSRNIYWLYTRQNPDNHQVIVNGNVNTLRSSNYNGNRPTLVILHGYNRDGTHRMNALFRRPYLARTDANVIMVDWSAVAQMSYRIASDGVRNVGEHLGDFLQWLIINGGGNLNNFHLVGYSLGAHVAGNAGRRLNARIARITGLDPAGPRMGGNPNALRANDAAYVETINVNGGGLGIFDPIGRANFYPNGGRSQPGCWIDLCSHRWAIDFFTASITHPFMFEGRRCADLRQAERVQCSGDILHMGNTILPKNGQGLFGLRSARPPIF